MPHNTSVFLDLLRLCAALFVVFSHFTGQVAAGVLPYLPGHAAVIAFFVLSGHVIAYAAQEREHGLEAYALNRLARLWSTVLPALLLTLLLETLRGALGGKPLEPGLPAWCQLLLSALFLNEVWWLHVVPLGNEPFWSLPYEFWYYVIFGAVLHLRGKARVAAVALAALAAGPKIMVYLPIWWLGVLGYRHGPARLGQGAARAVFAACLLALPLLYLLGYRSRMDSPWLPVGFSLWDYPTALCFAGLMWSFEACGLSLQRCERAVRWAAACTFTLYLCHFPLLRALDAALPAGALPVPLRLAAVLLLTLTACAVFAQFTERRKQVLLRWLRSAVTRWCRAASSVPAPARRNGR